MSIKIIIQRCSTSSLEKTVKKLGAIFNKLTPGAIQSGYSPALITLFVFALKVCNKIKFLGSAVSGKPGTKLTFNCTSSGNRPWFHNIPSGRDVTAIACHPVNDRVQHTVNVRKPDTKKIRFSDSIGQP